MIYISGTTTVAGKCIVHEKKAVDRLDAALVGSAVLVG
jgi:hypothetical protein